VTIDWDQALFLTLAEHHVGELELFERRRFKRGVEARQHFWWLLHERFGWGPTEIARKSGYDHTTVLSALKKARKKWTIEPVATNRCETPVPNNTPSSSSGSAPTADTTGACTTLPRARLSSCSRSATR
jgi:hypothetical protein